MCMPGKSWSQVLEAWFYQDWGDRSVSFVNHNQSKAKKKKGMLDTASHHTLGRNNGWGQQTSKKPLDSQEEAVVSGEKERVQTVPA